MLPYRPGRELQVDVEAIDRFGAGVGRPVVRPGMSKSPGRAFEIHVAGALPGERVRTTVEHVSPHRSSGIGRAWARLVAIDEASPDRVAPLCPAFGRCGGCSLQHWAYARQLEWKRQRVRDALAVVPALPEVSPCVASPRTVGYRNQAKLVFGLSAVGQPVLGGYAPRSHTVVDTTDCALVEPVLERVAAAIRRHVAESGVRPFLPATAEGGDLRHVVLRANAGEEVLVTLVVPEGARAHALALALAEKLMREVPEVIGVLKNVNEAPGDAIFGEKDVLLRGCATLEEEISGARVRLPARAFFQVNREVAALLYQRIAATAAECGPFVSAVDLYAGVGLFARALAPHARTTIAIESNPVVLSAYEERPDIRFINADAAHALASVEGAEFLVVNPPRAGCAPAVLAEIVRLSPHQVLYISCNPDTLARDLAWLGAHGLVAKLVVPYDMMPHTPHVETLVVLGRQR